MQQDSQNRLENGCGSASDVHRYLISKGYKISRTAICEHEKAGRLLRTPSGYCIAAALLYARDHLKPPAQGPESEPQLDRLLARLLQLFDQRPFSPELRALLARHGEELEAYLQGNVNESFMNPEAAQT